MNFLAPLFLLGAAAIAGPIIFHLIRRTTRERTPFSSVMFLDPSPPRISRRHRFEHLLLLLLRSLMLLLLAVAFARPFFSSAPQSPLVTARARRQVILIDTSASMRRAMLWHAAQMTVLAELHRAAPDDQVALYIFDDRPVPLLSFAEWARTPLDERVATAYGRLATITPGWGGTHLGTALIAAAEALADPDGTAARFDKQIVLISDVQSGSRVDGLQGYEWPRDIELIVKPILSHNPTNAGIQVVETASDSTRRSVRVRVTNSATAKREQFQLGWAGADSAASTTQTMVDAYVPAGQTRAFTLAVPAAGAHFDRVVLRGDDEPFDNTAYVLSPEQQHASVLWLGGDPGDATPPSPQSSSRPAAGDSRSPLVFLRRAYADNSRLAVSVLAPAQGALDAADLRRADLIFVGGNVSAGTAAAVRSAVMAGKTAVVVLRSAGTDAGLGALLATSTVSVTDGTPANYAMFADIDFRHPLFAAFADPRFSDFTKIHVWHYRRLDVGAIPQAHVLARFDTGDPAVAEVPVGKGRVVVFATGWQPEDSQIAVSSKFVPLMWSLLEMSGAARSAPAAYYVGAAIPPAPGATAVRLPTGRVLPLATGGAGFRDAREPGVYAFLAGEHATHFAVNLEPAESRTAPLSFDELEQLGVPVRPPRTTDATAARTAAALRAADLENRQKLWRWTIAATLVLATVESFVAAAATRRIAGAESQGAG